MKNINYNLIIYGLFLLVGCLAPAYGQDDGPDAFIYNVGISVWVQNGLEIEVVQTTGDLKVREAVDEPNSFSLSADFEKRPSVIRVNFDDIPAKYQHELSYLKGLRFGLPWNAFDRKNLKNFDLSRLEDEQLTRRLPENLQIFDATGSPAANIQVKVTIKSEYPVSPGLMDDVVYEGLVDQTGLITLPPALVVLEQPVGDQLARSVLALKVEITEQKYGQKELLEWPPEPFGNEFPENIIHTVFLNENSKEANSYFKGKIFDQNGVPAKHISLRNVVIRWSVSGVIQMNHGTTTDIICGNEGDFEFSVPENILDKYESIDSLPKNSMLRVFLRKDDPNFKGLKVGLGEYKEIPLNESKRLDLPDIQHVKIKALNENNEPISFEGLTTFRLKPVDGKGVVKIIFSQSQEPVSIIDFGSVVTPGTYELIIGNEKLEYSDKSFGIKEFPEAAAEDTVSWSLQE